MQFNSGKHILVCLFLGLLASTGVITVTAQEEPAKKAETKADKKNDGLPLKPERKIEFTTDEGTWISLDVSPDGKTSMARFLFWDSGWGGSPT